MVYRFKGLLQQTGWQENICVQVDEQGLILNLFHDDHLDAEDIRGYAIPGFQNAHSHAFQYAMAGLTERHQGPNRSDDFWSWREAMYNVALRINPEQMEAIATMLYSEMLRHGYTNVAEFHYVHNDQNGDHYGNRAELGSRLVAAAKKVGIGITLIPIFYQKGGFGKPPEQKQRRFISNTIDDYYKLLEATKEACGHYMYANHAMGAHSLRGVEPNDVAILTEDKTPNIPFHIHVSEQLNEIEDAINYLGRRPVEWMLEHVDMDQSYHLVHATHLTKAECKGLAASGVNVVLCPSTEANLGDGFFSLNLFQDHGGSWSIGTDSHVGISPLEELRLLDYGQRLRSHKRTSFIVGESVDSGNSALRMTMIAGRRAMNNFNTDYFKIGEPFNACVVDADAPLISISDLDHLISKIVYTCDANMLLGTIAHGQWVVKNNRHINDEDIRQKFSKAIKDMIKG